MPVLKTLGMALLVIVGCIAISAIVMWGLP